MVFKCGCSSSSSVGGDAFSLTSSSECDVDYLGESTKGDLNVNLKLLENFGILFLHIYLTFDCSFLFRLLTLNICIPLYHSA